MNLYYFFNQNIEIITFLFLVFLTQMLKDHLDVCRDEDDRSDALEIGQIADYDSDDEEYIDDPEDDSDGPAGKILSHSFG